MSRYIGQDIGGYRVIEPIGTGGMAKVFKAYQPSFDRFVALKVLPEHYAEDETYIRRFKQEAKIIASLEHRYILPVHDFGEDKGITYLAMRYLRGGTLKDVLQKAGGILPLGDTARIIGQVAEALDYAHGRGIVHRDVKPANVMIDSAGDAFLTDFGIAKVLEGTAHLTATGGAMGTPAYMSPEQGTGKQVDARSDIYSLGVMVYEMVTGRVPYEADTPYAVIIAHANDPLPLPSSLNPSLDENIERVIFKALAKRPEDRYATAGQMAQDFEQAVAANSVDDSAVAGLLDLAASLAQAKPSDEVTRDVRVAAKTKPAKRAGISRVVTVGLALVVVVLVIAIGLLVANLNGAREASLAPQRTLTATERLAASVQAQEHATATQQWLDRASTSTQAALIYNQTATAIALVPSRTPTQTPAPRYVDGPVLFEDSFDSGRNSVGWSYDYYPHNTTFDPAILWGYYTTSDGNAALTANGDKLHEPIIRGGSTKWVNYALDFDMYILIPGTAEGGYLSVDFRELTSVGFHQFVFVPNGCMLFRFRAGPPGQSIELTSATCDTSASKWHHIRIEAYEDQIVLIENSNQVITYQDADPHRQGAIAFNVAKDATIRFDNVKVTQLLPFQNQ